jgi:pyruvyltransferase
MSGDGTLVSKLKQMVKRALRYPEPPPAPPPAPPPVLGIDLFYWRPKDGRHNFGDHLSMAIVTKMAAERSLFLDEIVPTPRRLLAIGSVLHFASDGDVIWGSGFNGSISVDQHKYRTLDVRSVRGPLTRDFLERRGIMAPAIYGDPALLIKRLLGERFPLPQQRLPVAYVPNFADLDHMQGWENVVSPYLPWSEVIRRIIGAEHVISSSLHGLIIADAFGIPCTYLRLSETEGMFKYEDYVLGAGRDKLDVRTSQSEAVKASPMLPIKFNTDRLYGAFPWDLWAPCDAASPSSL